MTYDELKDRVKRAVPIPVRDFAVLIPVAETDRGLSLLFEVRAATLRTQPGEVCFPGGGVEEGESPLQAALRELEEELDLPVSLVEPGPGLPAQRRADGGAIYPVLGRLLPGWENALRPNTAEVAETFLVPLDFFRTTPPELYRCETVTVPGDDFPHARLGFPEGYPFRRGESTIPVWMWEGRPIWGLTARMVRALVALL